MALLGVQDPAYSHIPEGDATRGEQAVEFARWCGMTLYPWQEDLLRDMCRTDDKGAWVAREVVAVVARQNGKGEVLVARELAGIYLFGERVIFHSAHFMDTAVDAQKRLWEVISGNDSLMYWWEDDLDVHGVPAMRTGNGKEKITFPNGAEILFRTRTKKTGRGLSIDLLIFDECFDLPRETYAAMSKLVRARQRAQSVYISSPVNRFEHFHGEIFSAKRWAGMDGAANILFKEWSPAPEDDPFAVETWAKCNPSLVDDGVGAQLVDIEADAAAAQRSEALRQAFLVETLAQGNWVPRDADKHGDFTPIIDIDDWNAKQGLPPNWREMCLALDATPEGEHVGIVMALQTTNGVHLSLHPMHEFNRSEIVEAVGKNVEAHDPIAVVADPHGALSTLVEPLKKTGVSPELVNGSDVSQAYELFLTMWKERKITHDGDPRWVEALGKAEERSKNGRYRSFDRYSGNIACLVAASLAVWGLQRFGIPEEAPKTAKSVKYTGRARKVQKRAQPSVSAF